jgi:hypothetical protein
MANAKFILGQTGGQIDFSVVPSTPSNPSAGYVTAYSDGSGFYVVDSSGNQLIIGTTGAAGTSGSSGTSGTSGTSGISGSSGTSGTSGISGSSGTSGTSGVNGATGPAGPGASSPITLEQTNSLVSTAVGATAGSGSNCAVVIGNNACAPAGIGANSVVIGNGTKHYIYGSDSVVIGPGSSVTNSNIVTIGTNALGESQGGVNIGQGSYTVCNNGLGSMALGRFATAHGFYDASVCAEALPDLAVGSGSTSRFGGIAIGDQPFSCALGGISIGRKAKVFPGGTGAIVLGNSSVGGTGACNSVVIGSSAEATAACGIAIGNAAFSCATNSISIGNGICNYGANNVVIGSTINGYDSSRNNAVAIGSTICFTQETTSIGNFISNGTYRGIAIGYQIQKSAGGASRSVKLGQYLDSYTDESPISIGVCNTSCSNWSIQIGENNTFGSTICGANYSSAIGYGNTNCHACSSILGVGITTVKANAAHVNNLVAFGQAASLTNAIGSTGGSVTLNWDNSNIQTLTLTDNITTLTKSNPIDGAVYTLFITQGGTGGKTISWGTDIEWPGGTPPTLSPVAGAIDAVSLVYIAGITGYFGNANLNFS